MKTAAPAREGFRPLLDEAPAPLASATPAAPARGRIRLAAIGVAVVFALLAARAAQLAFFGPQPAPAVAAATAPAPRAQVTDRNGVLLIGEGVGHILIARPAEVWDHPAAARALARVVPGLTEQWVLERLAAGGGEVYLRRRLTREQLDAALDLGLAGIGGATEPTRVYPNGELAGQLLGYVNVDRIPQAGVERALNEAIIGQERLALSLDVRLQYAVERELAFGAEASDAQAAAGVLLDGRSGEVLALASWPAFDPNRPAPNAPGGRNMAVAARFEFGSVLKPFTFAMALDAGVMTADERLDVSRPLRVGDRVFEDEEPLPAPAPIQHLLARSSNIGAGLAALRMGQAPQTRYLRNLGFAERADVGLTEAIAPRFRDPEGPVEVASRGFGYSMAMTPLALARAYTVFVNDGARAPLTLQPRAPDAAVERVRVLQPQNARAILSALAEALPEGTGRRAAVPGVAIAGKTGTSRLQDEAGIYEEGRVLASFAAVFPADAPHYVLVIAVQEPSRGLSPGAGANGGGVAAPISAAVVERIAPFIGLRLEHQARPPAPAPAAQNAPAE